MGGLMKCVKKVVVDVAAELGMRDMPNVHQINEVKNCLEEARALFMRYNGECENLTPVYATSDGDSLSLTRCYFNNEHW